MPLVGSANNYIDLSKPPWDKVILGKTGGTPVDDRSVCRLGTNREDWGSARPDRQQTGPTFTAADTASSTTTKKEKQT